MILGQHHVRRAFARRATAAAAAAAVAERGTLPVKTRRRSGPVGVAVGTCRLFSASSASTASKNGSGNGGAFNYSNNAAGGAGGRSASGEERETRGQAETATTTTHFGYKTVPASEKEGRVREVFDSVADTYDAMNDLMSGGLHRYWKDYLLDASDVAEMSAEVRRWTAGSGGDGDGDEDRGLQILDVAGGTGDVACRFFDAAGCLERSKSSGVDPVSITVCDINTEMLRVGQRRAKERYGLSESFGGHQREEEDVEGSDMSTTATTRALRFVQGNAQDLKPQFDDDSFDLYTIAFGLRNVTDVDAALSEARRVLRVGGRFMCLEFSQVPNHLFRAVYDAYSFNVIPAMGHVVADDRESYQYLVESIRRFSNQDELVLRMERAGFRYVKYTNLTGGIVALHEGWKL